MRRMSGIWPPSNPGRVWPPERAVWPLPPRPAVLPIPDPGPRPLRMRTWCEPRGGLRVDRLMCGSSPWGAARRARGRARARFRFGSGLRLRHRLGPGCRGRHLDEVAHLVEHPPERRVVRLHHGVLMVLQAQRLPRAALSPGPADAGADLPEPAAP